MTDYSIYIQPELLVLVGVLYFVGTFIKDSQIKNKYIPSIVGGVGVVLATLYICGVNGVSPITVFNGITQGIICAGCAVYVNQIIKQASEKE